MYKAPIRGKHPLKKKPEPLFSLEEFAGSVGNVGSLAQELKELKDEVIEVVDYKIEEVDKKVQDKIDSITSQVVENIGNEVLTHIGKVKQGNPGRNADTKAILEHLEARMPTIDEIVAKVPKVDEKAITAKILKTIPANKETLKIIQKNFKTDPMSVIEEIMKLPEGKFKLKASNIDGLSQTISAFQSQLGRGYLHGGGDTVVAGTNITITTNAQGQKVISSTGGGGGISGVTGTSPIIIDNTDPANPIVTIQQSNTSQSGFLSDTDWDTFNNKQAAISFGTGVLTALGVNIGSAGAPVLFNGALGTPSSGVATNLSGTASGLTAGTVTTNANLTGVVTSTGNATTIADSALSIAKTSGLQAALDAKAPLASPTFTGTVVLPTTTIGGVATLSEGASIALDPSLSADGTWSGITMTATAGYTQAFGDLVYLDPTDSRWEACDANAAAGADGDARGMLGMVVVAGTDGTACTILLQGIIRADAKFATFTINNPIYASETAGLITQTQPTTTDVVIRVIGFAITADEIYFNPSPTYITHT